MSKRFTRFSLAILLAAAPAARAAEPDAVAALIRGGALELALKRLDDEQAHAGRDEWLALERRRLELYAASRRWDQLAQRVDGEPPDLPDDFRLSALNQAAEARLAANDPAGARRYLRRLLWQEALSPEDAAHARRLVIRSYLLEDNLADAQAGLLRYKQDYEARGDAWQVLHAEILLRAGDSRGAFDVLAGVQVHEARLLRLLAGLRAGAYKPREVALEAGRFAATLRNNPVLQRRALALAAEAAGSAHDEPRRIAALERALALPEPRGEVLLRIGADDLWQAYDRLAESVGNGAKLLVGDDSAWLAKAGGFAAREPTKARAFYAFLAQRGGDGNARLNAHRALADSLLKEGRGAALRALYTKSTRFAAPESVPPPVRYRLAEIALAGFDMRFAAQLMRGLTEPPEGESAGMWALKRARTMVYAGDYSGAQTLLAGLLEASHGVEPELARYFLQVVFDLQTAGRHAEAAALLDALYARVESGTLRRELLFWLADSKSALGRHEEAGELYLRSAVYNGDSGDDPWGQTARFHAAGALARAGMVSDARHIYTALLRAAPDPARRAQIERQLQQLWSSDGTTTP